MNFWFVFLGQHFSCLNRCRGRIQISEDKVHNTWKGLLSVLRLNGVRKLFLGGQFWMFVKIQRKVWAKREKRPKNDSILRTVVPYLWWITTFFLSFLLFVWFGVCSFPWWTCCVFIVSVWPLIKRVLRQLTVGYTCISRKTTEKVPNKILLFLNNFIKLQSTF